MTMRIGGGDSKRGLIFAVDAANIKSHVTGSTYWKDVIGGVRMEAYESSRVCPFPVFSYDNGGCFKFNPTDDNGLQATGSFLFPDDEITLEAWYRIDVDTTEGTSPRVVELWKNLTDFANDCFDGHGLISDSDGAIRAWTNEGPQTSTNDRVYQFDTVTGDNWTLGEWNHFVMTYGDGVGNVYWSGVNIDTTSISGGVRDCDRINIGNIGNWYATNMVYEMSIAMVKVYNKALTDVEVIENFNSHRARFGV